MYVVLFAVSDKFTTRAIDNNKKKIMKMKKKNQPFKHRMNQMAFYSIYMTLTCICID